MCFQSIICCLQIQYAIRECRAQPRDWNRWYSHALHTPSTRKDRRKSPVQYINKSTRPRWAPQCMFWHALNKSHNQSLHGIVQCQAGTLAWGGSRIIRHFENAKRHRSLEMYTCFYRLCPVVIHCRNMLNGHTYVIYSTIPIVIITPSLHNHNVTCSSGHRQVQHCDEPSNVGNKNQYEMFSYQHICGNGRAEIIVIIKKTHFQQYNWYWNVCNKTHNN